MWYQSRLIELGLALATVAVLAFGLPDHAFAQATNCRATTAAPTYAANALSPLSCDLSGNLRSSATFTPSGTQDVNLTKIGGAAISGVIGAAVPANAVPIAVKDNSGNLAFPLLDASGFLKVNVAAGGGSGGTSSTFGAAVPGTGTAAGFSDGTNMQMAKVDASNNQLVVGMPTSVAAAGITPIVSAAQESNHVLKAGAGNLYSVYVTPQSVSGYLMVFNATSLPANGAVTPIDCIQAPFGTTTGITVNSGPPDVYGTGITAGFSTTGCFTLTASATAFFKGRVK